VALIIADRVRETTTTTGTGNITLAGAATGYITFSSVCVATDLFYYVISGGAEWEVGRGLMVTSTTFARDRILSSSNSNSVVTFSAGTKDVFMTFPGSRLNIPGTTWAIANGYILQ
jgi:hypothetical protein